MKPAMISSLKQKLLYVFAVGSSIFVFFFVIAGTWIGNEVKTTCLGAVSKYGDDCVLALTAQLSDPSQTYKARNDATWALGQLGDPRALPTLQKYYTGQIPNREPWAQVLSQYELKKAINLLSGGPNITAWLWR